MSRVRRIFFCAGPVHNSAREELRLDIRRLACGSQIACCASVELTRQLEAALSALDVLTLKAPVDAVYGKLRSRLERAGRPIGGNDLLIAAHALAFDHTLATDSEREFSRVKELTIEN